MIPDDDEAEHVEDDAANLEAVLEPEEEGEGEEEAGEGDGEAAPADEEAAPAEEAPAEGADDAEGNHLLLVGDKLFKSKNHNL